MSTRDSGSPNLLDEFFAPPSGAEEEEVVEEVDEVDDAGGGDVAAAPRRSLPPTPPSMRAGSRPSAPPPRGRSAARASAPPRPPRRETLPGLPEPVLGQAPSSPEPELTEPPQPFGAAAEQNPSAPGLLDDSEPPAFGQFGDVSATPDEAIAETRRAQFDPQTAPGEFSSDELPVDHDDALPETMVEPQQPPESAGVPDTERGDVDRASGETDMATAFAASLSLRGDTPSGTDPAHGEDVLPGDAEAGRTASIFDALPASDTADDGRADLGPSSAWPSPTKIDEWDDEWAPSLSALGAREPGSSVSPASSAPKSAGGMKAPFRLSLPPPPPPPRRTAKLPLPRLDRSADVAPEAVETPPAAEAANEPAAIEPEVEVEQPAEPAEQPSIAMEVSPFGAPDEPSREDLTRPLPPTELARLAASEEGEGLGESELLRDDVTIPLPGIYDSGDEQRPLMAALPDPYTSDTDLTRPLIPLGERGDAPPRSLILPPLRSPGETEHADGRDVPHVIAVPPPSVGTVEQSPSIQITPSGSSEYTPTSELPRGFSPSRTSPGGRGVLPPIPKPAPVPSDFGRRGPAQSVAPVTGSVFPPGLVSNKRWIIAIAAAIFGMLALGLGLRTRSGSLVVTVAGPSGAAVPGISVRVDGTERCDGAPCIVKDLKPGMHLVSASATGLSPSAERAIVIEAGEQLAHHIVLTPEERATAGLSVAAIGSGLRVTVDGRDVGAPPVTLNDVTPGEHTVRIIGDDRFYQPYEEVVRLERGEVRSLGPVRLRVLRGRLELRPGDNSDGAVVAVDGRRVWHLPASIELSADESHEVTAMKQGFNSLTQEVVFDGTAERSVTIGFASDWSNESAPPPASRHFVATTRAPARAPARTRARASAAVAAPAPTGTAMLDLTSTPPAAVVVNGRPLGTTPLHNVRVGAGRQTVLFVHPSLGRKVASANVPPGHHVLIGVKF